MREKKQIKNKYIISGSNKCYKREKQFKGIEISDGAIQGKAGRETSLMGDI